VDFAGAITERAFLENRHLTLRFSMIKSLSCFHVRAH
jgi:hypothetical protein